MLDAAQGVDLVRAYRYACVAGRSRGRETIEEERHGVGTDAKDEILTIECHAGFSHGPNTAEHPTQSIRAATSSPQRILPSTHGWLR